MRDKDLKNQDEIRVLKAEVKGLRRTIATTFSVLAVAVVLLFPQCLIVVAVGAIGFFGFLISPLGRKVFPDVFRKTR